MSPTIEAVRIEGNQLIVNHMKFDLCEYSRVSVHPMTEELDQEQPRDVFEKILWALSGIYAIYVFATINSQPRSFSIGGGKAYGGLFLMLLWGVWSITGFIAPKAKRDQTFFLVLENQKGAFHVYGSSDKAKVEHHAQTISGLLDQFVDNTGLGRPRVK
jgi:hypothetical protein